MNSLAVDVAKKTDMLKVHQRLYWSAKKMKGKWIIEELVINIIKSESKGKIDDGNTWY